jgi:hypothetical protein
MFSITEIIAYPPPKVNSPILKKVRNNVSSILPSCPASPVSVHVSARIIPSLREKRYSAVFTAL